MPESAAEVVVPARTQPTVVRSATTVLGEAAEPGTDCWQVTTEEARALAELLEEAGYPREPRARDFELAYVSLVFEPIFPHGEWVCSGCG